MKVEVQLPSPHSPTQRKIFNSLVTPGLTETWVACGTKFGKTVSGSVAQGLAMLRKKQGLFRWVAPIYPQAMIGHRNISRLLPPEPWVITRQYHIEIPHLQTKIEFRSGDKPENLEGEACHGYVLDEMAKMKSLVYASAKTTTTMTQAPMLMLSTPRGKNFFYNKCMDAKEEMNWCLKKGVQPTKLFLTAPTTANPRVVKEVIDAAKRALPERLFRQYYEAEFLDDGSIFPGFRGCYYTELIEIFTEHQMWFAPDVKDMQVVIGADWAKTTDYTVFIAINIVTRRVVGFERFHKRPYTQAVKNLVRFNARFSECLVNFHDKTGVGQAIDDLMALTELSYEGITFTNKSKTDMVNGLITSIESKSVGLVQWNVLDSELDAYEVSTNALGTMTYSAPEGQHDDAVCALMLANAALELYADRDFTVKYVEDLKKDTEAELSPIEAYYRNLDEDDD